MAGSSPVDPHELDADGGPHPDTRPPGTTARPRPAPPPPRPGSSCSPRVGPPRSGRAGTGRGGPASRGPARPGRCPGAARSFHSRPIRPGLDRIREVHCGGCRRRQIAPVRKLVAAVLGALATFVTLFGLGMRAGRSRPGRGPARPRDRPGRGPRRSGPTWVTGVAHVHSVTEPPLVGLRSVRAQIVIDAPGVPARSKKILEPRVPVSKWPDPGGRPADQGRDRRPAARPDPLGRGAHARRGRGKRRPVPSSRAPTGSATRS